MYKHHYCNKHQITGASHRKYNNIWRSVHLLRVIVTEHFNTTASKLTQLVACAHCQETMQLKSIVAIKLIILAYFARETTL